MESILILDFGGQYNQVIARRVREAHVFCEVKPCSVSLEEIKAGDYAGIIFTGGPSSVYAADAPKAPEGL
ncbi:MAG TPA: GMP synthase (glutamine-hydrolyzing), partial [Methanocorpusculum sp.]|nr:GMP synthase (glutamine-hydrolyzing) [Methanocorpusculum sp.]